jgi:hypothetical protein
MAWADLAENFYLGDYFANFNPIDAFPLNVIG